MDGQRRIQDVYRKIEREKNIIQGAQNMRQKTDNSEVRQRLESNIRESQRNISYLEAKMQELQVQAQQKQHERSAETYRLELDFDRPPPIPPKDALATSSAALDPQRTPSPRSLYAMQPGPHVPKARPNYTKLDLVKYETPHVGPRIQLMLQQLAFKLSIEKQYKEGVEKMAKLYSMEGDRRNRADAESKRIESNQKISLLKQALKRYEDLHVEVEEAKESDDDSVNAPNIRRPLSGRLQIAVSAVKDIDHASTGRFQRSPETFVVVKVEDIARARTKTSKTDRWGDEFEIEVDKANEIEFTVYDKQSDHSVPIGMLWIRISDVAEELRRKKIEQEIAGTGWVRAERTQDNGGFASHRTDPYQGGKANGSSFHSGGRVVGASDESESNISGISAWFTLEPVGRIQLTINFVKQSTGKRPFESHGLGRQGAIRQRKEEVHEMYGHKFVQQQFYNIMRCALCGEFLKYSAGMQCSDCKYTCHKKCYPKVVTKCISKTTSEMDLEEEKINHRIPHRFEQLTNIGANWCCHCGYILPLGKKNARKCSECGLTCHTQCAHLVPDFCGMSMEMAHQVIGELRTVKQHRPTPTSATLREKTLREPKRKPLPQPSLAQRSSSPNVPTYPPSTEPASTGDVPQPPPFRHDSREERPAAVSRPSYTTATTIDGAQAARAAYRTSAEQQRPQAHRTSSAAAAAAAMQLKPEPKPSTGRRPVAPAAPHPRPVRPSSREQQVRQQASPYHRGSPSPPASPSSLGREPQYPESPQQQQQPPAPPAHAVKPATVEPPILPLISTSTSQKSISSNLVRRKIGLDDFNFLAVLGKGNFGKVMLAEARTTKRLFAIKVLKKEFIIENDEVESTRSEKRVFLVANRERHPFLLNLYACFQTETRVYFVMEYISGGDLMLHIQREQFSPRRAQFYAAEVCLALKYFHENGIIYRDLKLDNILLSMDGHVKIADYGLCKEEMWYGNTTSTFCGTPEFMAPEILLEQRYGRAVDWWAFGVLIYQMLLGQSPFRGEDEDEIFDAILTDEPLYPIHMNRDSVDILQRLLTREPEKRLGSAGSDAADVMAHPFFRGLNWDEIYNKRIEAPFVPRIGSETDTSNFDPEFTNEIPVLTPVHSVLTQAMQEQFRGFSYMNPEAP